MASKVGTANNKIILGVAWQGSPVMNQGLSKIASLQLRFPDPKTQISVELPRNLSPDKVEKLPFTCHRENEETHPKKLKVPLEQIKGLAIRAAVLQKSPNQGPVQKINLSVGLKLPKTLEIGQTYQLLVTSDFKARLIKDTSSADVEAMLGCGPVIILAKSRLTGYIGRQMESNDLNTKEEFEKLPSSSVPTHFPSIDRLLNTSFKTEIEKLDPVTLKNRADCLRALQAVFEDKSPDRLPQPALLALAEQASLAYLKTIEDRGFVDIIRLTLESLVGRNKTEKLQQLINQASEKWGNAFRATLQ